MTSSDDQQVADDVNHQLLLRYSQKPNSPERTVALRKLLEAKDAAVRAKVMP